MSAVLEALMRLERGELEIPEHITLEDIDKKKLRRNLRYVVKMFSKLVLLGDELEDIFGEHKGDCLIHVPKYGERAWLMRTDLCDVILWDEGNGWYSILAILPRSKSIYDFLKKEF